MSERLAIIRYPILLLMLLSALTMKAQNTVSIDTSEYLPLFYDGALEYNLIIAASNNYYTEVERLIELGAEVDARTSQEATPLIFAVMYNNLKSVETLIRYNADVNHLTSAFETPLLLAARNNNVEIAEMLVRFGADVDFQDRYGATALHYASIYGFFYLADLLIYYRSDIDKKSNDGTTPLMAAIWAGHPEVADLLIQNGANMEARDDEGFTPFLIAAQNGDTLMMNLLRKKGIDIYEKNLYDWDALSLAIKSDQKAAVEALLKVGDKWADPDLNAVNPYYVAAKYQRKEIFNSLEAYKIPSKYKTEFDQVILSLSGMFNLQDYMSGFNIRFKEPLTSIGITAGFDAKLWYSKVLRKEDEDLFMQYFDKSYLIYLGFFKEYQLTDNIFGSNFFLAGSLSGAYSFGNKFKGTSASAEKKFRIMPSVALRFMKDNFSIFAGAEYFKTEFYKNGPFWARVGLSYNISFDSIKDRSKDIKWY